MLALLGSLLAWSAAFWIALLAFAARRERAASARRFAVGLALGAMLAHAGWAAMNLPLVRASPRLLADPLAGFTVLGVPLGLLAAAPWRAPRALREGWLAAALGALPLAVAVARLGCVAAGCCHGTVSDAPWSIGARHPTALYESAAFLLLHFGVAKTPRVWVPAAALVGFGTIRLAVEPWRAPPPLGPAAVPPATVAAAWIVVGLALARRPWRAGARFAAGEEQARLS
jgi:hypothetical protein